MSAGTAGCRLVRQAGVFALCPAGSGGRASGRRRDPGRCVLVFRSFGHRSPWGAPDRWPGGLPRPQPGNNRGLGRRCGGDRAGRGPVGRRLGCRRCFILPGSLSGRLAARVSAVGVCALAGGPGFRRWTRAAAAMANVPAGSYAAAAGRRGRMMVSRCGFRMFPSGLGVRVRGIRPECFWRSGEILHWSPGGRNRGVRPGPDALPGCATSL